MTIGQLDIKLRKALRGTLSWEATAVLVLAGVSFLMSAAYSLIVTAQTSVREPFAITGVSFGASLRIAITVGFLVCMAGLASRRLSGVAISTLGISWVLVLYVWWQSKSVAFLRNAEVPGYDAFRPGLSHAGGLWQAKWWDLLLLLVATFLFCWQILVLVRVTRLSRERG